jgi:hypothetical protein
MARIENTIFSKVCLPIPCLQMCCITPLFYYSVRYLPTATFTESLLISRSMHDSMNMLHKAQLCMRTIRKVISGELLTKRTLVKNFIMYKNTYILKLLLNIVTTRIEALVIWRSKFFMPMSKKSAACECSHVLTPSINSLLKRCDLNQFFRWVNRW